MKNITNLNIFETNLLDGPMRLKYEYFPEITEGVSRRKITDEMTEEMKEEFIKIRNNAGEKYGFDGMKIIVPCEEDAKKRGDYFVADQKIYEMDDDLWNVDIPGDIVILKENNPGIVVAYPVSDDPVLIIEDQEKGAMALAHCNIDRISNSIPVLAVKALQKEVGSNVKNLKVYIGTHLKRENNKYLRKPKSITKNKEIWKKSVSRRRSKKDKKMKIRSRNSSQNTTYKLILTSIDSLKYRVDQEKAIINMLSKIGIDRKNILTSNSNTYDDFNYYSDRKANNFKEDLIRGKFLVGAYYQNTFPQYDNKCPYTKKILTKKL